MIMLAVITRIMKYPCLSSVLTVDSFTTETKVDIDLGMHDPI
jgi:hypothetical protein